MKLRNDGMNISAILFAILFILNIPDMYGQIASNKKVKPPNIVLVYVDDLGYSDISSYGRKYGNSLTETPQIDQLVKEGMKFTNAYSPAPLCSPSRAALLTGRSPARLNFEFVTKWEDDFHPWDDDAWINHWKGRKLLPPPFTLNLPLEEVTIAESLTEAGYETAISGKWHVASHYKRYKGWRPTHGPKQQGFDYTAETFGSHPYSYKNEEGLGNFGEYEQGEYPPDELTNRAINFINQDHDRPFFLYVSHYYVHGPIDTKAKWLVEKYKNKTGSDVSNQRIQYAAFVETLDHYVGQLLKAIDSQGLRQNTVVVLTSDNGGHPEFAFNRPFRGSKWNLYEGGIRIPLIVRWPGIVKKGTSIDVPVIQTDLMPTFRELAGLKGEPKNKLDGKSILPLLHGRSAKKLSNRSIVWHFPYSHPEGQAYKKAKTDIGVEDGYTSRTTPQSAIRKGRYKFIYFYNNGEFELYDLLEDPAEQNDLSKERPWVAKKMKDVLFDKLFKADARFPRINPTYKR